MSTSPVSSILETFRAMAAKVTTQTFTLLPTRSTGVSGQENTASAQVLGVMAMGYEAPPLMMRDVTRARPLEARAHEESVQSPVAQQKAVFNPDVNRTVHADWEAMHRHQTLLRHGALHGAMLNDPMVDRGMLA